MVKISRRKLALHAAQRIADGDGQDEVMGELAAYLIDSRRQREYDLLVRDIETALLTKGTAVVTTTSARELSSEAKASIISFVKSQYAGLETVALREKIDERVIGGVKIELPDSELDDTVHKKLEKLTVNERGIA